MYQEIIEALNEAENDPEVKICCITGNGPFFSSGNDLENFMINDHSDPQNVIETKCKHFEYLI